MADHDLTCSATVARYALTRAQPRRRRVAAICASPRRGAVRQGKQSSSMKRCARSTTTHASVHAAANARGSRFWLDASGMPHCRAGPRLRTTKGQAFSSPRAAAKRAPPAPRARRFFFFLVARRACSRSSPSQPPDRQRGERRSSSSRSRRRCRSRPRASWRDAGVGSRVTNAARTAAGRSRDKATTAAGRRCRRCSPRRGRRRPPRPGIERSSTRTRSDAEIARSRGARMTRRIGAVWAEAVSLPRYGNNRICGLTPRLRARGTSPSRRRGSLASPLTAVAPCGAQRAAVRDVHRPSQPFTGSSVDGPDRGRRRWLGPDSSCPRPAPAGARPRGWCSRPTNRRRRDDALALSAVSAVARRNAYPRPPDGPGAPGADVAGRDAACAAPRGPASAPTPNATADRGACRRTAEPSRAAPP